LGQRVSRYLFPTFYCTNLHRLSELDQPVMAGVVASGLNVKPQERKWRK
jgi:hypothetical protein